LSLFDVQTGLAGLGFDPGPCDGMYGPLTKDAVRKCRAAYRLGASGALGPELGRLIRLRLPAFRITTRACVGQSLKGVARELNTTVEAIIEGNRRKRHEEVFPGEQLIVHRRAALVLDGGESRGLEWTFVARQMEAAASVAADASDAGRCFGLVSVPTSRREATSDLIRQASQAGLRGILLELADSDLQEDAAWACIRCVRFAARACRKAGLHLAVTAPVHTRPPDERQGRSAGHVVRRPNGYDLEDIGAAADIVLLDVLDARDPETFRSSIAWACKFVPRWKLMAVIELRPYHMGELGPEPVSGEDLAKLKARHVVREGTDDSTGFDYLAYRARGSVRRLWRENPASLGRKLHAVNRLNILGAAFRGARDAEEQVLAEIGRRFIIM
jgi:hypothetical protein